MYLGLCQCRIDQLSGVMHIDDIQKLHPAHGDIHFHFRHGASEGIRVGLDLGRAFRRQMLAVRQAVQCFGGQLSQCHQFPSVCRADDIPVHDIQIVRRHPGQLLGVFQNPLPQKQRGLADRKACRIGLPGRISPGSERRHVRILAGYHMDTLQRHTQHICCHLCICRVRPLADLGLSKLHLQGAVLVQYHPTGRGFQGNGPHRRIVPEHGHADPSPDISGLVLILLELPFIINGFHGLVKTLVKGIRIQFIFRKRIHIPHRHQILPTEFQRIHAHLGRHVLGMAFHRPHSLRDSVAAHGSCHGFIRKYRICVNLYIVAGIQLRECAGPFCHDAVAVGSICPLVGKGFQLPGRVGAVRPYPGNDMAADGMSHPVGYKGVLPGNIQLHQMSSHLHTEPCTERLIEDILLIAESAADIRLDNPDLPPADAQRLADHTADNMRDLSRGNHRNAFSLHLRIADEVLDMAVLHGRRLIPAFHPGQSLFLNRFLIIPLSDGRMLQNIVRVLLMDLGRSVLHGFLYIQNKRILFILHLDRADRLCGGHFILRHHRGDVVSIEADLFRQDQTVRHILMPRIRGPWMACRRKIMLLLHVETSEYPDHAGYFFRFARIYGYHPSMSNRGMQYLCNIRAFVAQVIRILGTPDHLVIGIHTGYFFSYIHRFSLLMLSNIFRSHHKCIVRYAASFPDIQLL